jgi:hypothetical protein
MMNRNHGVTLSDEQKVLYYNTRKNIECPRCENGYMMRQTVVDWFVPETCFCCDGSGEVIESIPEWINRIQEEDEANYVEEE